MIFTPHPLAARQRPTAGARLARPISGGLWLPGMHGSVPDAACSNLGATINGTVSRVQGPFGGPALKLDGSSGYIDCGLNGNTALNWASGPRIPRTMWAWIRRPTSTSVGPVFQKGNNSPNSGFGLSVLTTGLRVTVIGSANGHLDTSNALSAGDWHMIAVAWDGLPISAINVAPGAMGIYLDGAAQAIGAGGAASGTQNSTDVFTLLIGKSQYVDSSTSTSVAFADLEIDHWGFDHRVYGPDEIADLYRRPFRNFMPTSIFKQSLGSGSGTVVRPSVFVCT